MTVYKFVRRIPLKSMEKIDPEVLADIFDRAENAAYGKLLDEVSRHYIGFIVDSEAKIVVVDSERVLRVELIIDMDISPLVEKVAEQDEIAERIAEVFFGVVEREIQSILEEANEL